MHDRAALCTLNNIEWCDNICRAHGVPGVPGPDIWIQPLRGPPYYSNGITVSRSGQTEQIAAIKNLKTTLLDGFSIKDSSAA